MTPKGQILEMLKENAYQKNYNMYLANELPDGKAKEKTNRYIITYGAKVSALQDVLRNVFGESENEIANAMLDGYDKAREEWEE